MQKILFQCRCALALRTPLIFTFIAGALYATSTAAALGESANQNVAQIQTQNVQNVQHIQIYQEKLSSGTQIREYADTNGIVVAVSWQGPTLPDLKKLLGHHFDAFSKRSLSARTPNSPVSSHRHAEFITDDLVVQSHGQMRSFSGRAWLPKLLPSGFNAEQIN